METADSAIDQRVADRIRSEAATFLAAVAEIVMRLGEVPEVQRDTTAQALGPVAIVGAPVWVREAEEASVAVVAAAVGNH